MTDRTDGPAPAYGRAGSSIVTMANPRDVGKMET